MPRRFGIDWDSYLNVFHAERAGMAEDVLSRASNGYHTPYRWLARAVSARAEMVLDIACGSGAMSRELHRPGRTVIGVDISAAELALAQSRGPGPWVRGGCRSPTRRWTRSPRAWGWWWYSPPSSCS